MFSQCAAILLVVPCVLGFSVDGSFELPRVPIKPRIVGGVEVRDRCSAPYDSMAAIRLTPTVGQPVVVCSAIMLTDQILVTTAYCMFGFLGQTTPIADIVVGERDLSMTDRDQQEIQIESFKIHEGYNATTLDNNIALIRLEEPAYLSPCVKPAIKMETDISACEDIDDSCIMVGWGPFAENGQPTNSRLPREAPVTVYGDLISSILSQQARLADQPAGSLLAEAQDSRVKACQLDWGGVVSCLRNGHRVLKGLIGEHNCNAEFPPVPPILVTDVTYFQPWIDRCVRNWDRCRAIF